MPATAAQRAYLLTLGRDIIDNYAFKNPSGTDDHRFENGFWTEDFATDDAGAVGFHEHMLGLTALSAVMWRVSRPREDHYRRYAINSLDTFFSTWQVPIVTPGVSSLSNGGGIWRSSAASVQSENGTAAMFGAVNIALAVCALGLESRWKTQILGMCDYAKAAGERTFYTNGNINVLKCVLYYLGARVSGFDPVRVADFETTIGFTHTPNAVAGGSNWLGWGYVENTAPSNVRGTGGIGFLTEVSSGGAGTDITALPRYDSIYTGAQSEYAAVGYLISGHLRFLRLMRATMGKLFNVGAINTTTSIITSQTGDSRFTTPGTPRTFSSPAWPILVWMHGDADATGYAATQLTQATNGLNAVQRSYFSSSGSIAIRNAGIGAGSTILAAHGLLV